MGRGNLSAVLNVSPKKPIGQKILNMNIKTAATIDAAWFDTGKLVAAAMATIHIDIPVPLRTKSHRLPRRSTAKNAIKEQRNFQVMELAATIAGISP